MISAAMDPVLDGKAQCEVGGAPVVVHPAETAPPETLARLQHMAVVCVAAARAAMPLPMGQHGGTQKPNCTQRNLRGPECCSPAQRAAGAAEAAAPPLPFQHGSHKAAAPRADRVHMGSPWDLHGSPWVSMGLHRSPWDLRGISMGLPVSTWVSMDLRGIRVASPRVFGDPRASSDVLNMFYPRSHWDLRDLRGIYAASSCHYMKCNPLHSSTWAPWRLRKAHPTRITRHKSNGRALWTVKQ